MKKRTLATAAPTASRWKRISKRRRKKKNPACPRATWANRQRTRLRRLQNRPLGLRLPPRSPQQKRKRQKRKHRQRRKNRLRKKLPRNRPKRRQPRNLRRSLP